MRISVERNVLMMLVVTRSEAQDEVPGAETIPGGGHVVADDDHSSLSVAQKTENLPGPGQPAVRERRREEGAVRVC